MSWLGALAMSMTSAMTMPGATAGTLPLRTGVPVEPVPIIGGEAVEGADWSNVVMVVTPDKDGRTVYLCSGTLIAPHIVLTAAHCIAPDLDPGKIDVYFGTRMTSQQKTTAKRFGLHPEACVDDCDPEAMDFAFIEIKQAVQGVEIILPLTEQADWDYAVGPKKPVTLVGFGAVRDDSADDAAPLRADERGHKRTVETIMTRFTLHGKEVIAGSSGKDSCGGDSGGPAFVQIADGTWRQLGVTSRGVQPCGTGYGYYGVPFYALPWLRDETGVDLLPAGCEDGDCLDTVVSEDGCGCRGGERSGGAWVLAIVLLGLRRRRPVSDQ